MAPKLARQKGFELRHRLIRMAKNMRPEGSEDTSGDRALQVGIAHSLSLASHMAMVAFSVL